MKVEGETNNVQDLLEKVRQREWDVVVMDFCMPSEPGLAPSKGIGLETIKDIKQLRPDLQILIFSVSPEKMYALYTMKAGASGYLNKESAPEELVKAIRRVHAGKIYLSASLTEQLAFNAIKPSDKPLHEQLSEREGQVMRMLAEGKSVSEIASELSRSVKTISTHRSRILQKMGMKSNADITRYAIEHHVIE